MVRFTRGVVLLGLLLTSDLGATSVAGVSMDSFGTTGDGQAVTRFTLDGPGGVRARVITYGATLTELWLPDRQGTLGDVVLGFDSLAEYEAKSPYFGCTTGRVANRIGGARFTLDGVEYPLAANDGANTLHGGRRGLDKQVWQGAPVVHEAGPAVRLTLVSPDGDEGFPGNLDLAVTYILTRDGELRLEYQATTDKATPVNLTNHSYFNLAGAGTVHGHILTLHASRYTEPDANLIPTGRLLPVAGTPLDFTRPASVGGRMGQVSIGGYDHNYVIDRADTGLVLTADLYEPASGRAMEVLTTEPGVQFYSGNFLSGLAGKAGAVYVRHAGLCLETQHYPDAVHRPEFPSIILRPGQTYRQVTVHRFSTR